MSESIVALMLMALASMNLPDPTRPPVLPKAPASEEGSAPGLPQLESILVSPSRRIAVIEGQVVQEGDTIAGARIISISPYSVRLDGHGGPFTLYMSNLPMKLEASEGREP